MSQHGCNMHAGLAWSDNEHAGNFPGRPQTRIAHAVDDDGIDAFALGARDLKQGAGNGHRRLELAFDRTRPCGYLGMGKAHAGIFQRLEIRQLAKAARYDGDTTRTLTLRILDTSFKHRYDRRMRDKSKP